MDETIYERPGHKQQGLYRHGMVSTGSAISVLMGGGAEFERWA
jgi:hypothetical protein